MSTFLFEPVVVLSVAGGVEVSNAPRASIVRGENMMAVKLSFQPGFYHPRHNHPEHESMGVVVSGHMRMTVGDDVPFDLFPGDVWHHPIGVYHTAEAVVASEAVEMHSPLRDELLSYLPVED